MSSQKNKPKSESAYVIPAKRGQLQQDAQKPPPSPPKKFFHASNPWDKSGSSRSVKHDCYSKPKQSSLLQSTDDGVKTSAVSSISEELGKSAYCPPSLRHKFKNVENQTEVDDEKNPKQVETTVVSGSYSKAASQPAAEKAAKVRQPFPFFNSKRDSNVKIPESRFKWILDAPPLDSNKPKITSRHDATSFVSYILSSSSEDKLQMLCRLSSSEYGLRAIQEALSLCNTPQLIQQMVLGLIRYLGNDKRMTLGSARSASVLRIIRTIFNVPNLFNQILTCCLDSTLHDEEEILAIAWFVLQLVKSGDEMTQENAEKIGGFVRFLEERNTNNSKWKSAADQISMFLLSPKQGEQQKFQLEVIGSLKTSMAGWRHDNDGSSIHLIEIYPTKCELLCREEPFLPETGRVFESASISRYFDWAFRLFRHDVVQSVREEIGMLLKKKEDLIGPEKKLVRCLNARSVIVTKYESVSVIKGIGVKVAFMAPMELKDDESREKYWKKRKSFLGKQALLALIRNENELVCLGSVTRRDLIRENPSVELQLFDKEATSRIFVEIGLEQSNLKAFQLSASFFAYAPILERLQTISELPFEEELLHASEQVEQPDYFQEKAFERFEGDSIEIEMIDGRTIQLDSNQKDAIVFCLKNRIGLIQGPPGTGKSVCGAIIANILHQFSNETILCVCYTNHALDQFLEDLMLFGLPEGDVIRIGGSDKVGEKMKQFSLATLLEKPGNQPFSRSLFQFREKLRQIKQEIENIRENLDYYQNTEAMQVFASQFPDQSFIEAFQVPVEKDGFQIVSKRNKLIRPDYLWQQWILGRNQGCLKGRLKTNKSVWSLPKQKRVELLEKWRKNLVDEQFQHLEQLFREYGQIDQEMKEIDRQSTIDLLKSKRVIGCTSTGAAIYAKELDQVNPGVLIIEEACELLEPHVVTSLSSNCKHLIMIGDHKQLRPKHECYQLSVESGSPFEFNRSLFERLVLKGFPHVTLELQHRMRPEFSDLIRNLTYPTLRDGEKVKNRSNLIGTISNLIFLHHEQEEGSTNFLANQEDSLSKVNHFEVEMVVEIVQYLLLQGYRADQIVVLTPYLGQLHLLRDGLSHVFEVHLSANDEQDLGRFGLLSEIKEASIDRRVRIRCATVDNFQGEEADVIVASLVRSNKEGIVGFVGEPERVNVLLSRARLGMILLGNMRTFEKASSTKARDLWANLLEKLSEKKAIFPGFPAHCSKHDRSLMLSCPEDFHKLREHDGGCGADCGETLPCGHNCPLKCHRGDHTKIINCEAEVEVHCPKFGHRNLVPCHKANDFGDGDCSQIVDTFCEKGHLVSVSCGSVEDKEFVSRQCASLVETVCPQNPLHSITVECKFSNAPGLLAIKCENEVETTCQNGHVTMGKCNQIAKNKKCLKEVEVACSKGGHCFRVLCHQFSQAFVDQTCQTAAEAKCSNGHLVEIPCGKSLDPQFIDKNCQFEVEIHCQKNEGHVITVPCCQRNDQLVCQAMVNVSCRNGNNVIVSCDQSSKSAICFETVTNFCNRGHALKRPCHENFPETITCVGNLLETVVISPPKFTHFVVGSCCWLESVAQERLNKFPGDATFGCSKGHTLNLRSLRQQEDKLEFACRNQRECFEALLEDFNLSLDFSLRRLVDFETRTRNWQIDSEKIVRNKFQLEILFD